MGTFSRHDSPFLDLRLPLELLPSLALSASYWVSSHLLAALSLLLTDSLLCSLTCRCLSARLPGVGGGHHCFLIILPSFVLHLVSVPLTPSCPESKSLPTPLQYFSADLIITQALSLSSGEVWCPASLHICLFCQPGSLFTKALPLAFSHLCPQFPFRDCGIDMLSVFFNATFAGF